MKFKHYLEYIKDSIAANWQCEAMTNLGGETVTYARMAEKMKKLQLVFDTVAPAVGDKVALYARNSLNWGITFLSVVSSRRVIVPLLSDFTPENAASLITHSESKILVIDPDKWSKIGSDNVPGVVLVLSSTDFRPLYDRTDIEVREVVDAVDSAFESKYPVFGSSDVEFFTDNFSDLAMISYTSGTSSSPKGVMLTHGNLSSNISFAMDTIPHDNTCRIVSMLPMAHLYGMMWEFLYQLAGGSHIYFLGKVPSPRVLLSSFAMVKPYMVLTVPLVIEKIFKGSVFPVVESPAMKFLLKFPIAAHLVKKRIRAKIMDAFGGNMEYLIIGGAAINKEVENWLKALKIPYCIGYGMTETAPLIGYADWKTFVKGSCGRVVRNLEIRVDSDDQEHIVGEFQVRGDNVMMGYYKNEEATAGAFTEDGWFRTGDLGIIDEEGNIFIKGRSKNMILSANGQNIYPEEIEGHLNNQPYVVESVVVERDKKIVALVYPDYDRVSQESLDGNDLAKLMEDNKIRLNLMLPLYSRINKIELMKKEFEKTPKKSIKRFLYK